jgi:hypothetical protein
MSESLEYIPELIPELTFVTKKLQKMRRIEKIVRRVKVIQNYSFISKK